MEEDLTKRHTDLKGCQLESHTTYRKMHANRTSFLHDFYCKTHNVACCRCGWEWGWHYGANSNLTKHHAKNN